MPLKSCAFPVAARAAGMTLWDCPDCLDCVSLLAILAISTNRIYAGGACWRGTALHRAGSCHLCMKRRASDALAASATALPFPEMDAAERKKYAIPHGVKGSTVANLSALCPCTVHNEPVQAHVDQVQRHKMTQAHVRVAKQPRIVESLTRVGERGMDGRHRIAQYFSEVGTPLRGAAAQLLLSKKFIDAVLQERHRLPSPSWLRNTGLPAAWTAMLSGLRECLAGKPYTLVVDETTERFQRCKLFAVVVVAPGLCALGHAEIMPAATSATAEALQARIQRAMHNLALEPALLRGFGH